MSTTTIRIDDALKARIAAAADQVGKSSHAFILDALSDTVERIEREEDMHRVADERWATLLQTGKSVSLDDAKGYMQALAAGRKPRRPPARKLAR